MCKECVFVGRGVLWIATYLRTGLRELVRKDLQLLINTQNRLNIYINKSPINHTFFMLTRKLSIYFLMSYCDFSLGIVGIDSYEGRVLS